ncbi:MAG: galactose mutarotase [Verrucomicrobia bacterium]|nr:galactose mutarotase [Verrucomicrobiota bacterium]
MKLNARLTATTLGLGVALLTMNPSPASAAVPSKSSFGTNKNGVAVDLYTLKNKHGLTAAVTTHGATLVSLLAPDRLGKFADLTMGFDSVSGYESPANASFGCSVGRYANRIANGKFSLDGKTYTLLVNNGKNHLHGGGPLAFSKVVWHAEPFARAGESGVVFTHTSADGEEGYPGTMKLKVTFTLTDKNELRLDYEATTDQPTVVNLTNHAYWNLAGVGNGDVLGHLLTLHADRYTLVDDGLIPTGEIAPVKGTPLDFTTPHKIGERIPPYESSAHGYDHNFVVNGAPGKLRPAARVVEPASGRTLEILTTEPAIQLYTGNHLKGQKGKAGVAYPQRGAFCLEAQHYPDSPNQPSFPTTTLRPGETYRQTTVHVFGVEK